jgi:hypothetical protein
MGCIKKQALDGVNETIQTIRAAEHEYVDQRHRFTLVVFGGNQIKTLYDRIEIAEAKELSESDYTPDGSTPLYDAMGQSLTSLRQGVQSEDKVLVTVITDGEENASREYSGQSIKALVEELKLKGWVFAYMGANQDVESVGASMSITNTLSYESTEEGVSKMFEKAKRSYNVLYRKISTKDTTLQEDFFSGEKSA